MSKLIIVSNRLPVSLAPTGNGHWDCTPATGGLVTALMPVLERRGGVWVGWPGISYSKGSGLEESLPHETRGNPYSFTPIALTQAEIAGFYRGFSNEVLWPLFHDLFARCVFDSRYWQTYLQVNRKFAKETLAVCEPGDFIWVHDYHLMRVASELRSLGAENRIGFFLHVPFPAPDIYRKIPWRRELLDAVLDYDQIGFQTEHDRDNFLDCVVDLLPDVELFTNGASVRIQSALTRKDSNTQELEKSRSARVGSFPISIDYKRFATLAASSEVGALASYLVKESKQRCIILGVDRLDYSKGLGYKLAAFRTALERYPVLRKQVTLMQHVVPSREEVAEYQKLRLEIEHAVGEINGEFSAPGWVPVHYFYHTLAPEELSAYYRIADIALVTPLKDGMNLVSKEYCASRIRDDGVLILSEFAGAAGELGEGAIVVNPFDVDAVADAIHEAFTMEPSRQRSRMRALRTTIRAHDVHHWVDSFLGMVSIPHRDDMVSTSRLTPGRASRVKSDALT